ncbi:M28 family peptidase [Stakelama tenebrarum]|uniref:M28 family peptidase n=1 Tax=Stakelama tenebrarum TaxID=2711215 RepID=A0A6G6YAK3_9SPHN|nr:M28 family peptidase [Sphingosinithalassobacter tenebrarum]QIG81606.1 M28 family peptidase [Sphingosinithalassobacter tenebrarum]
MSYSERRKSLRWIVIALLLLLVAVPIVGVNWMLAVPGESYSGPLPEPDAALAGQLRADVTAIASEPHNVAHPHALERAAQLIETKLVAAGHAVRRQTFEAGGVTVRNIEAVIEPADPHAHTLVIGAHYDSAGNAPGANDNGSGTAVLLALARNLSDLRGKAAMRIRLVFFVNEEPPWFKTTEMGSLVYAKALAAGDEPVAAMFSLETMGYYSDAPGSQKYPAPLSYFYPDTGDFIAFVGTWGSRPLVREAVGRFREHATIPSVGGSTPGFLQGIDWSDHWAFEQAGYPGVMITDTAPFRYPWYHDARDLPDKVDYRRLALVTAGLEAMVRGWGQPVDK